MILILDVASGRLICDREIPVHESGDTGSIVFSADGDALYHCSSTTSFTRYPLLLQPNDGLALGDAQLLDPETGYAIADRTADRQRLVLLNIRTGGVRIVTVAGDKLQTINRWTLPGVYSAAFNPDGTELLANFAGQGPGAAAQKIQVRRVEDGALIKELPGPVSCDSAWSANGRFLAITSNGQTQSTVWDTSDWHALTVLKGELGGDLTTYAISPHSDYAVITHDDRIHLVSLPAGTPLATSRDAGRAGNGDQCRFLPDENRFAILWQEGRIDIVDPTAMRHGLATLGLDW